MRASASPEPMNPAAPVTKHFIQKLVKDYSTGGSLRCDKIVGLMEQYRSLPSVDRLLNHHQLRPLSELYPHSLVVEIVRRQLEEVRRSLSSGQPLPSEDEVVEGIVAKAQALAQSRPR